MIMNATSATRKIMNAHFFHPHGFAGSGGGEYTGCAAAAGEALRGAGVSLLEPVFFTVFFTVFFILDGYINTLQVDTR